MPQLAKIIRNKRTGQAMVFLSIKKLKKLREKNVKFLKIKERDLV